MSVPGMIGAAAALLLAVLWIAISFSAPGARRSRLEWCATLALYVVLISIMGNGLRRFASGESRVLAITFGFLTAFFSTGFLVALVAMVRELRHGATARVSADATH